MYQTSGPQANAQGADRQHPFCRALQKPKLHVQVLGNLQITATALPDQAGFDELQGVSGNALIANIGAGITLFQNPMLTNF